MFSESRIIPRSFNFYTQSALAANGSSLDGHCSNVTLNPNGTSTCRTPTSSVLMDGNIPTLTGLDGDTWASQLMILHQPEFGSSSHSIYFDFSGTPGVRGVGRVEVTIFNCPQWGTAVRSIAVSYRRYRHFYPTFFSCNSLLKLCYSFDANSGPVRYMYFSRYSIRHYVHIAEIAFYNSSSPCPFSTIIPGAPSAIINYTSKHMNSYVTRNQCGGTGENIIL